MSAALLLQGDPHHGDRIVWVAPASDDEAWLMVRVEPHPRGLVVQVPLRTRVFEGAILRGRALVLTPAGEAWLEQPCTSSVLQEAGDTATVLLCPAAPPVLVLSTVGGVPRT